MNEYITDRYTIKNLELFNQFVNEYSDIAKIGIDPYHFDIPYTLNNNNGELEFEILALEEYPNLIDKFNIIKV